MALRAATRGSALARWQTDYVLSRLGFGGGGSGGSVVVVETTGDRVTDVPIHAIGGRGVFVKEVQAAVLEGRADIAVHSAKDLTSTPTDGLVLAAFPERGDARDALVGCTLSELPAGARVATGSVRRRAQLAWLRPDLVFSDLRGNIDTRLRKASGFDAVVMAAAALQRLDRTEFIAEVLDPSVLLPQVAQGALAVECREDDLETLALLASLDHAPTRLAVTAERAFLAELGGGCDLPVGAHAVPAIRDAGPAAGAAAAARGAGAASARAAAGAGAGAGAARAAGAGAGHDAPPAAAASEADAGARSAAAARAAASHGAGPSAAVASVALTGLLAAHDGRIVLRETRTGTDPVALGLEVARHLLDDAGGAEVLFS